MERCTVPLTAAPVPISRVSTPTFPQQRLAAETFVPSAVLPINLVHLAAVLATVLGSRIAEIKATQSLIIHGLREFRLAKVSRLWLWLNYRYKSCSATRESFFISLTLSHQMILGSRLGSTAVIVLPRTPQTVFDSQKLLSAFMFCQ